MRISRRKYSSPTQRWTQRQHVILLSLVAANLTIFAAQWAIENIRPGLVADYLGISHQGISSAFAWQFVSAIFLHVNPWHLALNILVLCLLGRDLETILGQRHFLYLYFAGAIGGELGHLFLMPDDSVLYAASGGTAAILFAYATVLPELEMAAPFRLLRLKAKNLAYGIAVLGAILLLLDRQPLVWHSALLGGGFAGWLYAHLLGFGRPSFVQRMLHQRRTEAERYEQMSVNELITTEVDPLLEKISQHGWERLTRGERRALLRARQQILQKSE
jgi:membrane associated rhomboid family serine protease